MDIYEIKFNNGVDYNAYDIERALRKVYKNAPRLSVVPASLALPKVDREKLANFIEDYPVPKGCSSSVKLYDQLYNLISYSKKGEDDATKFFKEFADAIITEIEGRS